MYAPAASLMVLYCTLVCCCVATTVTPGIIAPVESVTSPAIEPALVTWAGML